jgi:hypothetical protein
VDPHERDRVLRQQDPKRERSKRIRDNDHDRHRAADAPLYALAALIAGLLIGGGGGILLMRTTGRPRGRSSRPRGLANASPATTAWRQSAQSLGRATELILERTCV